MEFAVIETGGKQYRVAKGESLSIEIIKGTFKEGDTIVLDKVLMVDDGKDTTIGTPYIDGASVSAVIEEIGRHDKVIAFRYKAKSNRQGTYGRRQPFFKIKVTSIK